MLFCVSFLVFVLAGRECLWTYKNLIFFILYFPVQDLTRKKKETTFLKYLNLFFSKLQQLHNFLINNCFDRILPKNVEKGFVQSAEMKWSAQWQWVMYFPIVQHLMNSMLMDVF